MKPHYERINTKKTRGDSLAILVDVLEKRKFKMTKMDRDILQHIIKEKKIKTPAELSDYLLVLRDHVGVDLKKDVYAGFKKIRVDERPDNELLQANPKKK